VAGGGTGVHKDSPATKAWGLDLDVALVPDERALLDAVSVAGERGGADAVAVSVDRLAQLRQTFPAARLRAVLLLSRSRGQDVVAAAAGIDQIPALRGRRIAAPLGGPGRYFLLWSLAQAGVSASEVRLVPVATSIEAGRLLREARVDAAAGSAVELAAPARERGGRVIASTADAPHLVALVLAVRADVLARYPDAVRRLTRSLLDAAEAAGRDPTDAARMLSASIPQLGDPFEALKADPPAGLADNLSFFGVRGDAPVRYEELFTSASALWRKLGEPADTGPAPDSRELGPLLAVAASPTPH
jgi:ABC-type nitrate/sulfonate/bicarbonate transport system substrate-binding protein